MYDSWLLIIVGGQYKGVAHLISVYILCRRVLVHRGPHGTGGMHPTSPPPVHQRLKEITTPLRWEVWDQKLVNHPEQRFRRYIIKGIKRGFDYTCPLNSAVQNMPSVRLHPEANRD